jgi:hypothetical protein
MASFTIRKYHRSLDQFFFIRMQSEALHMIVRFEDIFMYYSGSFELLIDKEQPKVKYKAASKESPDPMLLEAHLSFLEKKLKQIAGKL